jgi:hypothetical protein
MKKTVTLIVLFTASLLAAQTIPVTFHFTPEISNFQKCRLVGTFNGWNNADPKMADPIVAYLLPRGVNTEGDEYIDTSGADEPVRVVFAATPVMSFKSRRRT